MTAKHLKGKNKLRLTDDEFLLVNNIVTLAAYGMISQAETATASVKEELEDKAKVMESLILKLRSIEKTLGVK